MAAYQAPPSLGLSRQEHWSELPFPSPMHENEKWKWSCSVVSDSSRPHGLQPTRRLHPRDFQARVLEWVTTAFSKTETCYCCKSRQSCPTLCDPIDGSPPGSSVPEILQARTLEWVAISFSNAWKWKVKVKSLSRVRLLATPRTVAYEAPLSMGFPRQEYWSGVPLPSHHYIRVRRKWEILP